MPWKATYPKEIRNQMIELVQAGMSPVELSRKHEPSADVKRHPELTPRRHRKLTPRRNGVCC